MEIQRWTNEESPVMQSNEYLKSLSQVLQPAHNAITFTLEQQEPPMFLQQWKIKWWRSPKMRQTGSFSPTQLFCRIFLPLLREIFESCRLFWHLSHISSIKGESALHYLSLSLSIPPFVGQDWSTVWKMPRNQLKAEGSYYWIKSLIRMLKSFFPLALNLIP